ncbi:hypothetical protein BC936DRAFT_138382 [Jimgerdemannia flammicorona]|uniref:Uncharacterized protein n=1 Tax=Jimgerdemannia flammicorona TaxID=994334 RepID=A0A433CJY0_9FUNG|nr:hypothetical protein BC936DRAFT_138382 [Jimgerdemannia flammicorona]
MYFSRSDVPPSLQSSDSMTTASPYNGYPSNGAAAFLNGPTQGASKAFHVPKQNQPLFQYHQQPLHHPDFPPPNGMATPPPSTSHPPPSLPQASFQHVTLAQPPPMPPSPTTSGPTATFDLQEVIAQFHSQPELLKLILASKVEEDKRKGEEAKLRAKQIDLILLERGESGMRRTRSYGNGNRGDEMLLDGPNSGTSKGNEHGIPAMSRNMSDSSASMQHGSSFQDNVFHSMSGSSSPRGPEFAIPIPIQAQCMRRGSSGSLSNGAPGRDRRDSAVGSLCSSVDDDKPMSDIRYFNHSV